MRSSVLLLLVAWGCGEGADSETCEAPEELEECALLDETACRGRSRPNLPDDNQCSARLGAPGPAFDELEFVSCESGGDGDVPEPVPVPEPVCAKHPETMVPFLFPDGWAPDDWESLNCEEIGAGHSASCDPDVTSMCSEPCLRVPEKGDCGQEATKPVGNEGHFLGCGYYRFSVHDDAGQSQVYIHALETGGLVYYEESRQGGSGLTTTRVGCEPACENWQVIPCPSVPLGGAPGQ